MWAFDIMVDKSFRGLEKKRFKDSHKFHIYLITVIYLLPLITALFENENHQRLFALYLIPVSLLAWLKGLKGIFYSLGFVLLTVTCYFFILKYRHVVFEFSSFLLYLAILLSLGLFIGHLGHYATAKQEELQITNNKLKRINNKLRYTVKKLEEIAVKDGLTSLYNHRYFHERLKDEISKAKELGGNLSLMFIDIDYFKHYNDIYGHIYGDKVLKDFGKILRKSINSGDIAFRYGGEEFAILSVGSGINETLQKAMKIKENIAEFPFYGRKEQPGGKLTVSIGVSNFPNHCTNKEQMVKLADEALYKAKNKSRNCIEVYNSIIDQKQFHLSDSEYKNLQVLRTILLIVNARDRYTYGHSERVVEYSTKIAEKMGLKEQEINRIKIGAYLHDIGKIQIPMEILNKKGKLSKDEMNLVKIHPVTGAESISAIKGFKDVLNCILHHHERFDGQGYPNNLKGDDIPLEARIIAVADSFDAMTSQRPYHNPKSIQEAILEISRCSGSQFDPLIAEVFIDILQNDCNGSVAI